MKPEKMVAASKPPGPASFRAWPLTLKMEAPRTPDKMMNWTSKSETRTSTRCQLRKGAIRISDSLGVSAFTVEVVLVSVKRQSGGHGTKRLEPQGRTQDRGEVGRGNFLASFLCKGSGGLGLSLVYTKLILSPPSFGALPTTLRE
jgi:hypothetical protein